MKLLSNKGNNWKYEIIIEGEIKRLNIEAENEAQAQAKAEQFTMPSAIDKKKNRLIRKVKYEVSKLLQATDYKVLRHLGQKELASKGKIAKTKLTDTEYETLELEREAIRDWSNQKEIEINNATTIEELNLIETEY